MSALGATNPLSLLHGHPDMAGLTYANVITTKHHEKLLVIYYTNWRHDMEVIYKDGSTSTFTEGGSYHAGELAIQRIRLLTAKSALKINIESGMEMTRDGSWAAVMNVIAPITGKDYRSGKRLTVKGKREALADCIELLATLEHEAVIYEED